MTTQAKPELLPPSAPALALRPSSDLMTYTAAQMKARVDLVLQVMDNVMKKGIDYGDVPGCNKPSLFKPGSEKLLMAFRIAATPEITDLSTADKAHYRVAVHLHHVQSGEYLGTGIGEASSEEKKYRWREAVCQQEFDEALPHRRNKKWYAARGKLEAFSVNQIMVEPADIGNTVLKMAKKRAQIDATLTATAASAVFMQDVEDLAPEIRDAVTRSEQAGDGGQADFGEAPRRDAAAPPTNGGGSPGGGVAKTGTDFTPDPADDLECSGAPDCPCGKCKRKRADAPMRPHQPAFGGEPAPRRSAPPAAGAAGPVISEQQGRRFYAIWKNAGLTKQEVQRYLQQTFGITDDRQMPVAGYEDACKWAEGK